MAMGHGGGGPSGSVANHPRAGFSQVQSASQIHTTQQLWLVILVS